MRTTLTPEQRSQRVRDRILVISLAAGMPVLLIGSMFMFILAQHPSEVTDYLGVDAESVGCAVTAEGDAAFVTMPLDVQDPEVALQDGMPNFLRPESGTLQSAELGAGRFLPSGTGFAAGQNAPDPASLDALLLEEDGVFGRGEESGSTLAFVVKRTSGEGEYGFGSFVLQFAWGEPAYRQTMPLDVRVADGECHVQWRSS